MIWKASGSFILTGEPAGLYLLPAASGSFILTGEPAGLYVAMLTGAGTFIVTGLMAGLYSSTTAPVLTFPLYNNAGTLIRTFDLPYCDTQFDAVPTTSDDSTAGFVAMSLVANRVNHTVWVCADNSAGAAVWVEIAPLGATWSQEARPERSTARIRASHSPTRRPP